VQICQNEYTGCKLTLNQSCKILSILRKHTSSSEEMQVKSIWVFWMDGGMDGGWTGKHFSIGFQFSSLTIVVSSVAGMYCQSTNNFSSQPILELLT
jgi:hypothetical protein